jgi:hypothetical protein
VRRRDLWRISIVVRMHPHIPPMPCVHLSAGDSRTGTPRLGAGLVAGLLAHGVRLALVLGHASVHRPAIALVLVLVAVCLRRWRAYCTMSGRMGALKTLGSGWLSWLGAPSAPWMVTVGRDMVVEVLLG